MIKNVTKMVYIIFYCASAVLFFGTALASESYEIISDASRTIEQQLSSKEVIVFKAWDGTNVGPDSGADISIHRNGKVTLTELGFVLKLYKGTYVIQNSSEIVLSLAGYGEWPIMLLAMDKGSLILIRKDGKTDFQFGHRGGAYLPDGENKYWPFRQIDRTTAWKHNRREHIQIGRIDS